MSLKGYRESCWEMYNQWEILMHLHFSFTPMQLFLISIPLSEGENDEHLDCNLPTRLFSAVQNIFFSGLQTILRGAQTAKKSSCANVINRWMFVKIIYHLVQSTTLQELTEKGCELNPDTKYGDWKSG